MNRTYSTKSLLLLVGLAAVLLAATRWISPAASKLLPPGSALPALTADGWLNGPLPEKLDGQVVVVDVWAYWCGPCRASMPELVANFTKYHERGVQFVGLTGDGAATLDETRAVVEGARLTWPQGYGAIGSISALGVQAIPAVFVVDRRGRIVWNSDQPGTLEQAIDSALQKS